MKADMYFVFVLQFCVVFFTFVTGRPENAELPPTDFPANTSNYKIINIETVPPIEFPSNNSTYKIIHNTTILKTLISNSSNTNSKIDTEVADLNLHVTHPEDVPQKTYTPTLVSTKVSVSNIEEPDQDAENIENDASKTEDSKLSDATRRQSDIHGDHGHTTRNGIPMLHGELAAILAGVFAMIAVAGYIGLLTWRRYLEHRYGNREMLIDEEEYTNYNDLKNFEL